MNLGNIAVNNYFVKIKSTSRDLIERLQLDFCSCLENTRVSNLYIYCFLSPRIKPNLPPVKATFHRENSITFDLGDLRYNDYHGNALSVINFKTNRAYLYADSIDRLHELAYLLILSRSGKYDDLHGTHKIHASGFVWNQKNVILSLPSGGGKTTVVNRLLKNPEVKIIADDCPYVSITGKVSTNYLRLGVREDELLKQYQNDVYTLERQRYGKKVLLSTNAIQDRMVKSCANKHIIIFGSRTGGKAAYRKKNRIYLFKKLIGPLIIGEGLPQIFEYFWEPGLKDFFRKSWIALSRLVAAIGLTLRSECYEIDLSYDIDQSLDALKRLVHES